MYIDNSKEIISEDFLTKQKSLDVALNNIKTESFQAIEALNKDYSIEINTTIKDKNEIIDDSDLENLRIIAEAERFHQEMIDYALELQNTK